MARRSGPFPSTHLRTDPGGWTVQAYFGGMFSVESVTEGERLTVRVAGDIDLSTADKLAEALEEAVSRAREVRVDLAEVTFLDSTGIRSLVQGYRAAQARGSAFYVTGAQHWVAKVLEVTGVGPLLAPPD
jgi:anti-sigma B factor antagonist